MQVSTPFRFLVVGAFNFAFGYGVQIAVNVGVIRLCVTTLGWNAYAVQFVTLVSLTFVSYWAHKLYSFGGNAPMTVGIKERIHSE